jgi:hypothetical protein
MAGGGVFRQLRTEVFQLRFLLVAREADAAMWHRSQAVMRCSRACSRAALESVRQRQKRHKTRSSAHLRRRGPQLLLVGLAACGVIAHVGVVPPASTTSEGHQDVWLRPKPPASPPHRLGSSSAACGGLDSVSAALHETLPHQNQACIPLAVAPR